MNKEQALNFFWSQFGLIAYDENSVPDNAQLPYITYETSISDFDNPIPLTMSLWYYSSSWEQITLKAKEIIKTISRGGTLRKYDGGGFWIVTTNPQYQRMSDSSSDMIRRIVINVMIEFID